MTSQVDFDIEECAYLLRLLKNHSSLYRPTHEFYNDEIMQRGSWGQIGISMSITGQQAQNKWKRLVHFYKEETMLRDVELANGIEITDDEKSPLDPLYNRLHEILQEPEHSAGLKNANRPRTKKPPAKRQLPSKSELSKSISKDEKTSGRLKQQLLTAAKENQQVSSNAEIGKLIVTELLLRSSKARASMRMNIFQCVTQGD